MLYKFMQLTRRILKVLSIEYTEVNLNRTDFATLYFDSAHLGIKSRVNITIQSHPNTTIDAIFITEAHVDNNEFTVSRDYNIDTSLGDRYMNIIKNIFKYNTANHPDSLVRLIGILYDDIAKRTHELLNYSDEELRLYINLL